MRDRLIELLQKKTCLNNACKEHCAECGKFPLTDEQVESLADYLLANGVIVAPCKVGDKVWAIRDYKGVKKPQESVVSDMYFTRSMELMIVVKFVARGVWGKTVFLTREEAERALKGGEG